MRIYLVLVLTAVAAVGQTPEPPNKFNIQSGKMISGTEEYSIQSTADGYSLTCKTTLTVPGSSNENMETASFAKDWSPLRYKTESSSGGVTQSAEAWLDKTKFKMKTSGGSKSLDRAFPSAPRSILLDPMSPCLMQAMMNRVLAPQSGDQFEWMALIPKRLTFTNISTPKLNGEAEGKFNGQPMRVRRYRVYSNDTVDLMVDASGKVMMAGIVLQELLLTRQGFEAPREPGADCLDREVEFAGLPGTICVPRKGTGPFPVVVLVHSAGPQDRDETNGTNKPFRDIARGLAARGIATFRYVKRTKQDPESFEGGKITLEAETIADAVGALKFIAEQKDIDSKHVYLLGHGLGGLVAPLITTRAPGTAGIILLAALARPLDIVVEEQLDRAAKRAKLADDDPQVQNIREMFVKLRSPDTPDSEVLFGVAAGYWREFYTLKPLDALRDLTIPVLVLQNGAESPTTDYDILMKTLEGKPASLAEGHLMRGTVPDVIAAWMQAHK